MFKFLKRGSVSARRCSFCNKSEDKVRKLISSPQKILAKRMSYICDECVQVCALILKEADEEPKNRK